ncbi:hypothetical protein CI610_03480 [invertebrate metagenome]|uniref:Uncharacterized protein n=1 Tax=invertebrate metagenome TaxID=1711999 RepID=A0A2H9T2Y7_9ZZZZ
MTSLYTEAPIWSFTGPILSPVIDISRAAVRNFILHSVGGLGSII